MRWFEMEGSGERGAGRVRLSGVGIVSVGFWAFRFIVKKDKMRHRSIAFLFEKSRFNDLMYELYCFFCTEGKGNYCFFVFTNKR